MYNRFGMYIGSSRLYTVSLPMLMPQFSLTFCLVILMVFSVIATVAVDP